MEVALRMKHLSRIALLFVFVWMTGCATYGANFQATIESLEQGDYQTSEEKIKKAFKPDGKDALLYRLELAVVKHLAGEFEESNALLEEANALAEDLETARLSEGIKVYLSNPRSGSYAGTDFEKVFINYYKALNYFALAQNAETRADRLDALEGARIESRRLITRMNELNERKGNYAAEDEEASTFKKVLQIFAKFQGELIDLDELQYRDDAMAHYMTGISFEMNGEYDEARISYEKAAQSYERGYAKQYRLGDAIIEQAWFDTIRMMRIAGGYGQRVQTLSQQKLSATKRAELKKWNKNSAQVIVLEDKGLIPHREEMSLYLSVNPANKTLDLRPWFSTKGGDSEAALEWFYILYADKDWRDTLGTFMLGSDFAQSQSDLVKTVGLGPLWDTFESLGLMSAIAEGLRVTVPYYSHYPILGSSTVVVGGEHYPLLESSNLALIAGYEQVVSAGGDIVTALARSAFKTVMADQLKHAGGVGGLLSSVGKLAAAATEAAETRNWLLLPQEIRVQRILLQPGEHHLALESQMPEGLKRSEHTVNLKAGETALWRVRTLPNGSGNLALTQAQVAESLEQAAE